MSKSRDLAVLTAPDELYAEHMAAVAGIGRNTFGKQQWQAKRRREAGCPRPADVPEPAGRRYRTVSNGHHRVSVLSPWWTREQCGAWMAAREAGWAWPEQAPVPLEVLPWPASPPDAEECQRPATPRGHTAVLPGGPVLVIAWNYAAETRILSLAWPAIGGEGQVTGMITMAAAAPGPRSLRAQEDRPVQQSSVLVPAGAESPLLLGYPAGTDGMFVAAFLPPTGA
jgi:hypothetical protein